MASTRQRKVFPRYRDLVEAWLIQEIPEGRTTIPSAARGGFVNGASAWSGSPRMFFTGPTIYSYGTHFPIATLDHGVVYFNLNTDYSATTSTHCSEVRAKLMERCDLEFFRVLHVPTDLRYIRHSDNLQNYATRVRDHLNKARKAVKYTERWLENARMVAEEANRYAEYARLNVRVLLPELSAPQQLLSALVNKYPVKLLGEVKAEQLIKEVA